MPDSIINLPDSLGVVGSFEMGNPPAGAHLLAPAHYAVNAAATAEIKGLAHAPLALDPHRAEEFAANIVAMHSDPHRGALDLRASDDEFWPEADSWMARFRPYVVQGGVLRIPVRGSLLNDFGYTFGDYATGYQYIEAALRRGTEDPEVHKIALMIDSPGGMVSGLFELTDALAASPKPLFAMVSGGAYSAAYAIAATADEIVVGRSGGTGSVGVVTMHVDFSEALAGQGIKVTLIHAGKHKVDGNPYNPLPKDVQGRIQARIDKLYGAFVSMVAENRPMSEDAVRQTEALTYDAEESVEVGFADRIDNIEEAVSALAATASMESTMPEKTQALTQADMDAAVAAAVTEATVAATAAATKAERERHATVLASEHYAGREALAHKLLAKDLDAETIADALSAAPKAAAPAAKADENPFTAAMNAEGGPGVGTDAAADADADADPVKAIMADFAAAGGTPHSTARN